MTRFRISLTDGQQKRCTFLSAPDPEFAAMKAAWFFEESRWRVTAVRQA
jgi:hypothetical protein